MSERTPQDTAALMLVAIVGVFVVGSLVALVVGQAKGMTGGEAVWGGLFSLATAVLGAVAGWIGGTATERSKKQPPPELPPD